MRGSIIMPSGRLFGGLRVFPGVYSQLSMFLLMNTISKFHFKVPNGKVTMGGDFQTGCLADRLVAGLSQPVMNP
eukprot:1162088-Pelagomonas_calceolata.AAC.2